MRKIDAWCGYMPLPIVIRDGFGYYHMDYAWYYSSEGTYVREGYGQDGTWI